MELFKASNQWQSRPVDERFWTLGDARKQCAEYRDTSEERALTVKAMHVIPQGDDLFIDAPELKDPAKISHFGFGQLCQRGEPTSPAAYLRNLPPHFAANNLNHCLAAANQSVDEDKQAQALLHHHEGEPVLRACTSQIYTRLWNAEIFNRLLDLPQGWRTAPARPAMDDPRARAATSEDLLAAGDGFLSIREGDMIAPAGIYASDHDMFAFLVNENNMLDGGLARGIFVWNSEVGDKSFGFCEFKYNAVCGNHIVWGATGVKEFRAKHVGDVRDKGFAELRVTMKTLSDASISDEQAIIEKSKTITLGATKEMVVSTLLGLSKKIDLGLNQKLAGAAYDIAEVRQDRYGEPTTLWASVNGLTEYSQTLPHAEARNRLDRTAGKMLNLAS